MPHEYQTTGESTAFLTGGIYGLPVFVRILTNSWEASEVRMRQSAAMRLRT